MSYLENALLRLEYLGISDVLLPFLLIFTIIYAVMTKTNLLGKDKKNFNIIIALVFGLSVVIPHITGLYPRDRDVVDIINTALPGVSLVAVIVITVLLIIGLFGGEYNWAGSTFSGFVAIAAFIVVIYIFGAAANIWGTIPALSFLNDPDVQALVIIILVFALIIYYITKEDTESSGEGFVKSIMDAFKKS